MMGIVAFWTEDELSVRVQEGWNDLLRPLRVFPSSLSSAESSELRLLPKQAVAAVFERAPFVISCGDNGDHLVHIVPASESTDRVMERIYAEAQEVGATLGEVDTPGA